MHKLAVPGDSCPRVSTFAAYGCATRREATGIWHGRSPPVVGGVRQGVYGMRFTRRTAVCWRSPRLPAISFIGGGITGPECELVLLVANELVANAVDHARALRDRARRARR